jgi:hypothetical protein
MVRFLFRACVSGLCRAAAPAFNLAARVASRWQLFDGHAYHAPDRGIWVWDMWREGDGVYIRLGNWEVMFQSRSSLLAWDERQTRDYAQLEAEWAAKAAREKQEEHNAALATQWESDWAANHPEAMPMAA